MSRCGAEDGAAVGTSEIGLGGASVRDQKPARSELGTESSDPG